MRIIVLFLLPGMFSYSYSQTTYEVTPGTKGNQIILSLENISDNLNAEDLQVKLSRASQNLSFKKEERTVEKINPKEETEAEFSFDIKREVAVNTKDTIEFTIIGNNGVFNIKQFILNYTPPKDYKLEQNFPNPFNPTTTIQYQLPTDSKVLLIVYDILGNEVEKLVNEIQPAGYKEIKFDASNFSSGVYIYRITAGNYISTKKMLVLK